MMNRARVTVVLLAVLAHSWTFLTALGQQGEPEALTAASVLEKARQTFSAFSSIEYEFRRESIGPGKQSNQSRRTEWGRFEYADGKSRSEFAIDSDDFRESGILAFDGKDYQIVRENRFPPLIRADDDHPCFLVQPVMMPFIGFLVRPNATKQPRLDLGTFRGSDFWSATKDAATLDGRREVDGHVCVVVKIKRKGVGSRILNYEVCLARDLDCYPILINFDWGLDGWTGTMRIVEFADMATAKQRVIVPIRIESNSRDGKTGNQSSAKVTIDKATLKVNEPINSKRFDLRQ
jgi:hypothetical protein